MKILVADDSKSNLELITIYLITMGHEVTGVSSGEMAIQAYKTNLPDLIILDAVMPDMDGFDCAKKIRELGDEDWIPIIFLSAAVDDHSVVRGINAGGDDYLTKPVSMVLLEAKINAMQRISTMRKKLFNTTKKLSVLSVTDSLTGVYNRLELDRIIKKRIEKAEEDKTLLALFLLDLDNFKSINDSLGHYIGDLLLKEVSKRLSASLRKNDFLARMGGDEFAIILQIESMEDTELIANKITSVLSTSYNLEGNQVYITASIGIACYPLAGTNKKMLMQSADIAMYQAKTLGRNNYQYFTQSLIEKNNQQTSMEKLLTKAIENHELFMVYQPIFDLNTGEIKEVEALVRWMSPEKEMILPRVFIPIAEESNLINKIGEWILNEVCAQIKEWKKLGLLGFTYSINVSSRQLLQKKFPQVMEKLIKLHGLSPASIQIEITENLLMNHLSLAEKVINEINHAGIGLAIDNFGSGYSSLIHLKQFPIASLKIDGSFIRDIHSDPNDAIILTAIIALGNNLGLKVVAKNIESKEQLEFLHKHHCSLGQGYYLSEPLKAEEMTQYLHKTVSDKLKNVK